MVGNDPIATLKNDAVTSDGGSVGITPRQVGEVGEVPMLSVGLTRV